MLFLYIISWTNGCQQKKTQKGNIMQTKHNGRCSRYLTAPDRIEREAVHPVYTICLLILLLLVGCSASELELWQKPGGNQVVFNLDSRECRLIAEKIALQHSATGKRLVSVYFNNAYQQCLVAKGWQRLPEQVVSSAPPAADITPVAAQLLYSTTAKADKKILKGFGERIVIPDAFKLLRQETKHVGPTTMEHFVYQDDNNIFMTIIFQENNQTSFERISYPIVPPYYIYTAGSGEGASKLLEWAAFWGKLPEDWVMGLGAYYYVNKNQRIIIVITGNLSQPVTTPPARVTLSREQHHQIDAFASQWRFWIEKQFPNNPGLLIKLKNIMKFGPQ